MLTMTRATVRPAERARPLFEDGDSALRWAARVSGGVALQLPATYALKSKHQTATLHPETAGLTDLERHGQAAQVVSIILQQDPLYAAYAAARYWRQVDDAIPFLRPWVVAGLPTGIHQTRAVDLMIRNCFPPPPAKSRDAPGEAVRRPKWGTSMRVLRAELRQRMETTMQYQRRVRDRMALLHTIAVDHIEAAMREKGLVAE